MQHGAQAAVRPEGRRQYNLLLVELDLEALGCLELDRVVNAVLAEAAARPPRDLLLVKAVSDLAQGLGADDAVSEPDQPGLGTPLQPEPCLAGVSGEEPHVFAPL